jgi:Tfp pilus assembly protein FimT
MGILSKKGLTYIELMIALVMVGIICIITYQDYRGYMLQQRLSGAAFAVRLDLMLAKAQAINLNRDVRVAFSASPSSQYIFDDTVTAATKDIQAALGYYDVTLWSDNNPIFSSRGNARNASGTNPVAVITLSSPAGSKTLTVNISGNIVTN